MSGSKFQPKHSQHRLKRICKTSGGRPSNFAQGSSPIWKKIGWSKVWFSGCLAQCSLAGRAFPGRNDWLSNWAVRGEISIRITIGIGRKGWWCAMYNCAPSLQKSSVLQEKDHRTLLAAAATGVVHCYSCAKCPGGMTILAFFLLFLCGCKYDFCASILGTPDPLTSVWLYCYTHCLGHIIASL